MQSRLRGNEYRTTIVCIDSYEQGVPSGRFYNSYQENGKSFHGLVQFLTEMEETLDAMNYPQSFNVIRSFAESPEKRETGPPKDGPLKGDKATFAVKILFRQNASWQGSITWMEGKREQSFRSVLELIFLMSSVLGGDAFGSANEPWIAAM